MRRHFCIASDAGLMSSAAATSARWRAVELWYCGVRAPPAQQVASEALEQMDAEATQPEATQPEVTQLEATQPEARALSAVCTSEAYGGVEEWRSGLGSSLTYIRTTPTHMRETPCAVSRCTAAHACTAHAHACTM